MATGKHVSLAAELEREIQTGRYGWEGGLPSVPELIQKWGVSINTVKSALSLLEGQRLIVKRGVSYYVNRVPTTMTHHVPPAHVRLPSGYCQNVGDVSRRPLPAHLATKLAVSETELVVYRVQVSGEEGEDGRPRPLQLSYRYHLLSVSDAQLARMQEPTYDPMWNEPGVPIELVSHDEVTSRQATTDEARHLDLPASSPVTSVYEVIYDTLGTPLMVQELALSPRTTLIFEFPFTNRADPE